MLVSPSARAQPRDADSGGRRTARCSSDTAPHDSVAAELSAASVKGPGVMASAWITRRAVCESPLVLRAVERCQRAVRAAAAARCAECSTTTAARRARTERAGRARAMLPDRPGTRAAPSSSLGSRARTATRAVRNDVQNDCAECTRSAVCGFGRGAGGAPSACQPGRTPWALRSRRSARRARRAEAVGIAPGSEPGSNSELGLSPYPPARN